MGLFGRKNYGVLSREYDGYAKRVSYGIHKLNRDAVRGQVYQGSYERERRQLDEHYTKLIKTAAQLQKLYSKPKTRDKEKAKIEKKLGYLNESLKEINEAYKKLDEDQTKALNLYVKTHKKISKQERRIINLQEEREERMLKRGESLEKKLEKLAAIFLLVSASASFGYALFKTLFRSPTITGAAIGASLSPSTSLLLSTLALILVIFIVFPSDEFNGLFKKKK